MLLRSHQFRGVWGPSWGPEGPSTQVARSPATSAIRRAARVQDPQHDDQSRDARQLPSGVILARGTEDLSSTQSHAPTTLKDDPRPPGCENLTSQDRFRLRQGQFRILYVVDDTEQRVVTVVKIGHRRDVYR